MEWPSKAETATTDTVKEGAGLTAGKVVHQVNLDALARTSKPLLLTLSLVPRTVIGVSRSVLAHVGGQVNVARLPVVAGIADAYGTLMQRVVLKTLNQMGQGCAKKPEEYPAPVKPTMRHRWSTYKLDSRNKNGWRYCWKRKTHRSGLKPKPELKQRWVVSTVLVLLQLATKYYKDSGGGYEDKKPVCQDKQDEEVDQGRLG